ncbi:MAG: phosphoglycerate kinase [Candidatus Aminicenantes bacterium]|nr:phosphoglycerate kinase [Candidatus Aminicenantes bacterium]
MKTLSQINCQNKKVFLRVDFNVPLDEAGNVRDDTRIRAALPTIRYLLDAQAKLVVASHLGRPKGKYDPKLSLKSVAQKFQELIGRPVTLAPDVVGAEVEELKSKLEPGQILLLENLRFHPGETANDENFAQKLASQIDVYVNDAFGASHRAHASVVGMVRFVPEKAAGFLMEKEVTYLRKAIENPERPYVAILGGAKVSDKIAIIESLLDKANILLVGGAMAYTFFRATGQEVGQSFVENDQIEKARAILDKAKQKGVDLYLPVDHVVAPSLSPEVTPSVIEGLPIPAGMMAGDIGPKTITMFVSLINQARTIFWNGPVGVFEFEPFSKGTFSIAKAIAASTATSIVGGGDSVSALKKAGVTSQITHVSTGGGASLEFIAYGTLPGIDALD